MTTIEFDAEWQRSSPLGAVFFFERAVKGLVGNLPQLGGTLAVLVTLWRESPWFALLGFIGLLMLCAAVGLLRYWHFRFRQDERGIRIRQGIFKKEHLDVEYDRIQGINVEQSPIFRWLGLVAVRFDTAGSTKQEGHLPAVTREFAEALRVRVERRARAGGRPTSASPSAGAEGRLLLALGNSDMLRIAVTDPSVLVGLVAIPALLPQYGDAVKELAEAAVTQAATDYQDVGPALLAVALLGIALAVLSILLLVAVGSAFLRFHGYQLRLEERALRSRGGLLTRKEVVVATAKIQQVVVMQGLVLRLFGRYRLRALPAGSGRAAPDMDGTGTQRLQVPLLRPSLAHELRTPIFGDEGAGLSVLPTSTRFTAISPHYIRARTLAYGVVPALAATFATVPIFGAAALACLAWVLFVALLAWQSWRRYGYMHDDHGLASRWGLLGRKVSVCLFRKVQAVTVVRSPMQRRKGLATLHVHVASGVLSVPFMDYRHASDLRDYILYKAESSRLAWH